jgi:hypothetical protein
MTPAKTIFSIRSTLNSPDLLRTGRARQVELADSGDILHTKQTDQIS